MSETAESAVNRALRLPEILACIFEHIFDEDYCHEPEEDDDAWMQMCPDYVPPVKTESPASDDNELSETYYNTGVLMRCALVSRLWSEAAIPLLWSVEDLTGDYMDGFGLVYRFENISPSRRPFYAKHVQAISLHTCDEDERDKTEIILGEVEFPKVERLRLLVRKPYLPVFNAPNLQTLEIDPYYEKSLPLAYVAPAVWPPLLEQIATKYTGLTSVLFDDLCYIDSRDFTKFKAGLPNTSIQSDLVRDLFQREDDDMQAWIM